MTKDNRYRQEREVRLDSLLRKIEKQGVEALTSDERAWLERVSGELRHELGIDKTSPEHDDQE